MVYFQTFVSAAVSTAFIVALARLLLSFLLSEPKNYVPALCVGAGFLIGHYTVTGPLNDPDTVAAISKFLGSASGLVITGLGFRYRARMANVA